MRRISLAALTLTLAACVPPPDPGEASAATPEAPFVVLARVDSLAGAGRLWPGFDASAVPVAIYDGTRTLLFRHPFPVEGFTDLPGHPGVRVYTGRHPSVFANTNVQLGGAQTATAWVEPGAGLSVAAVAGLVAHESFHVFQATRHVAWQGNEADLFTYPVDDAGRLAARRLESAALRRGLTAADAAGARCHAAEALRWRGRLGSLPAESGRYERAMELYEGLARWVQHRVSGDADSVLMRPAEYAPDAVRDRAYASGAALAVLLDRLSPGWKEEMEAGRAGFLDELLARAAGEADAACRMSREEEGLAVMRAETDVDALASSRRQARAALLARPGWTLVVATPADAPLWPKGFDPLNVRVVAPGEVLHARFLRLGNDSAAVEVMQREALTVAAGAHPLFTGVRCLVVSGLPAEPAVTEADGHVEAKAEGVTASAAGGVRREGTTLYLGAADARCPPTETD